MSAVLPKPFVPVQAFTRQDGAITPDESGDAQLCECILGAGTDVERFDWRSDAPFIERLSMNPAAIRLGRLQAGASVLDSHNTYGPVARSVIGHIVAGTVKVSAGRLLATVMVTDRAVWEKTKLGSIRAMSLGYKIHAFTSTAATPESKEIRLATDWEPYEVSFVPMGADPNAAVQTTRSLDTGGNRQMDGQQTITEDTLVTAERAAVLTKGMPEGTAKAWLEAGITERQGRTVWMSAMQTRDAGGAPQGPNIIPDLYQSGPTGIHDQADRARGPVVAALLHRMNPIAWPIENSAGARELVGLSLRELERSWKRQGGRGWLESRSGGSHVTGDFASLTADALGKELRRRYLLAVPTWQGITMPRQASDFKQLSSVQLGDAPKLLETIEHAEITHGTMSDASEKYRVKRYSRVLSLTYELIINDDLGALMQVPTLFSMSARQTESDVVWAALTDNPDMQDGNALFHADHNNIATPAAAIDVASLGKAAALLRSQKSLDDQYINPEPAFVIVSPANETKARQFTRTINAEQGSNVNPFDNLEVIVEPRLTGTVWYLATSAEILPTLEVAHLMGGTADMGPEIATMEDFDSRALKFRAEIAVGARAIDWRGITRNNGA